MFDRRLKQLRLARGLSLEELAAKTGGIVTKQAISKYEKGKIRPTFVVLNKLAEALNTKAAILFSEPKVSVELIAYRKAAGLPKRELDRVEAYVKNALEERIQLQELAGLATEPTGNSNSPKNVRNGQIPIGSMRIGEIEDTENAAKSIRDLWNLGIDAISNMTETLENHFVHVIELSTYYNLDGISAVAKDEKRKVKAAAVANRSGIPGERQRLNLAHELGHLVLDIPDEIDEEKAAFRFGAAFLAPEEQVKKEVGNQRAFIQPEELLLLKRQFGLSIQALLYRLKDLEIISDSYYRRWCMDINRLGWKKAEPNTLRPEISNWVRRTVLRGLSEGLLTSEEAARFLGESVKHAEPSTLIEKKAFLKLPLEERRRRLAEQAAKISSHYEEPEIRGMGGGDFAD